MKATFVLAAMAAACAGCATRPPVTQGFRPSGGSWYTGLASQGYDGSFADNQLVQVFVPRVSGTLLTASLCATRVRGASAMYVRLTEMENGLPSSTLGEVPVEPDRIPTKWWRMGQPATVVADFAPASIRVKSGRQYALVFSTRVPGTGYGLSGALLPGTGTDDKRCGPYFRLQNGRVFDEGPPLSLFMELAIRPGRFSFVHKEVTADPRPRAPNGTK